MASCIWNPSSPTPTARNFSATPATEDEDAEKLGNDAGAALLARGGDQILEAVYGRGLAVPPQP